MYKVGDWVKLVNHVNSYKIIETPIINGEIMYKVNDGTYFYYSDTFLKLDIYRCRLEKIKNIYERFETEGIKTT